MIRLWGQLIKKNKMIGDHVAERNADHDLDNYLECIHTICRELDLPRPIILKKHELELMQFHRTRFLPADFVESVVFDRFDVEVLIEKKKHS